MSPARGEAAAGKRIGFGIAVNPTLAPFASRVWPAPSIATTSAGRRSPDRRRGPDAPSPCEATVGVAVRRGGEYAGI